MTISRMLASALLLVAFGACGGMSLQVEDIDGNVISQRNGKFFVNDTAVEHQREVNLAGELTENLTLRLATASGLIDVVGVPGNRYELVLDVYTEFEGDGEVFMENGSLRTRTSQGGEILVNGIRGRVPQDASVSLYSGTGEIVLTALVGQGDVAVNTGTGPVTIEACNLGSIEVDTGTGDISLVSSQAFKFDLDSGTGDLRMSDCEFQAFQGDSGTGSFRFQDSRLEKAKVSSGTGDVLVLATVISDLVHNLGTGAVIER